MIRRVLIRRIDHNDRSVFHGNGLTVSVFIDGEFHVIAVVVPVNGLYLMERIFFACDQFSAYDELAACVRCPLLNDLVVSVNDLQQDSGQRFLCDSVHLADINIGRFIRHGRFHLLSVMADGEFYVLGF